MFGRLFQLAAGLAAAVGWVFALVVVREWPAVIISALFTFTALYGDLWFRSLASTWRYSRLKRAGFQNECTHTLSQEGYPWGTTNFEAACLDRTVRRYDWSPGVRELFPAIIAFTDDHSFQHEYARDYEYSDAAEKAIIDKFWAAFTASTYPSEDAASLIEEHGYEIALHAVENDLPLEYAARLA